MKLKSFGNANVLSWEVRSPSLVDVTRFCDGPFLRYEIGEDGYASFTVKGAHNKRRGSRIDLSELGVPRVAVVKRVDRFRKNRESIITAEFGKEKP